MQNYFLQVNLYLILFYGLYGLFLRRETFFKWNRTYLLSAVFASLVIPAIPIPEAVNRSETIENLRDLSEPILLLNSPEQLTLKPENQPNMRWEVWLWGAYFGVVAVLLVRFVFALFWILRLAWRNGFQRKKGHYWILMQDNAQIFSFFNLLFWGAKSDLTLEEQSKVIQHELVHIRQFHSLDVVLFELVQITFWLNPITYFYKKSIRHIHEYLADAAVLKQGIDKKEYATLLVQQSLAPDNLTLSNTFFNHSLLKSRIKMMNQTPSQTLARLKFVIVLPILAICMFVASCSRVQFEENSNVLPETAIDMDKVIKLIVQKINANSSNKFKYMFEKNKEYVFEIYSKDDKSIDFSKINLKLYQAKNESEKGKLVASNLHKNRIRFNSKSNEKYILEVENTESKSIFLDIYVLGGVINKSLKTTHQKERAVMSYWFKDDKSQKIKLEEGNVYTFFLAPESEFKPTFSLLDSEGNLLLKNQPADFGITFVCDKTDEYIFKVEVGQNKDKKCEFLVFSPSN